MVDINDQTEKAFSLDAFLGLDKPVNKVGGVSTKSAPKPVNAPVGKQSFKLTKEDKSLLLDFVPVVGDIKGAYETVDMISSELEKENPNYFLIGILGGVGAVATIIGLVPGAGDVAQKALMAGARSVASGAKAAGRGVVDLAQRVEVDPNAMGSMGGNIMLSVFPPAENAARTQIAGTLPTYKKADTLLKNLSGEGKTLDFGAGLGLSKKELNFDTYEPFPKGDFTPDFNNPADIPSNSYKKVTNLNVLNVVPRKVRDTIVQDIGRVLEPNGRAVITTRGRDVMDAKGTVGPEPMSIITSRDTYQKGFTQPELNSYITETLGKGFKVTNNKLGAAGVTVHKLPTKNFNEGGIVMNDKPKYPDAAVVDKDNQEIGFSLGGNLFLNEQGENSLRKSSLDIPEGEKVSTKEGSMFTRFSLGSDLDNFIIDMSNKIGDKIDVDLGSAALRYKIGDNSNIYIENIGSDAPSIGYRFSKRFNEGGLNMSEEDQMQDMLVSNPEQGMAETVDPVSGNDVPPGSLPAEVRDDVPAQLSEGEYVVPADVVRYFGVKAFEDMRMQAKQGMADMDAEGRIGGDPMQEEALPFSDEELMTVDTPEDDTMAMMNEGGVVYAANGVDIPPGVIVDNPYGGGYGLDPNDPTQVVSGIQGGLTGTGYEYKTYYNAAGLTVVIPFFDGVAQAMIPEGYASEAPKAEVAPSSGSGGNDASDGFARAAKDRNTPDPVDYTKSKDPAELQKAIGSYYSRGNKLAKNLGFAINPLAGLGIYMVEKNNLKNIQSSVNALPDGEEKTNLELLLDKDKGKELRAETYETGGGFKSFLADIFGVGKDEVSDAEPSDNTPTYKYNTKYNTLSSDGAKIGGISLGSERDAYERAVESGDDNAVFHYEAIDSHRQRQNEYAASNEGKDPKDWTGGSGMSESSKEQAQKYGGSVAQARQGGSQRTGGAFSSFETSAQQTQREDEEDNGVPKNKGGLVQRPKKKKKNK